MPPVSRKQAEKIVAALIDEQRPLPAVIAVVITVLLLALTWKGVDNIYANSYAFFLPLGAAFIGLVVRLVGRGITTPFRLIAMLGFAALCATMFFILGVRLRGVMPLLIPGVLVIGGFVMAGWFSRRELHQQQEIAYWRVFVAGKTRPENAAPWLMVPVTLAALVLTIPVTVLVGEATGLVATAEPEPAVRDFLDTPEFAERARRLGRPLGYERDEAFCHDITARRLASCSDVVCEAQNPYVLEGCLETAGLIMEDDTL
ncbi:MAG: hypothetical protein KJO55_09105 [Gammaproteobacteria bacterium]|nr:hypothetical protein [Gammaproteobacteria bacterium]NND60486.1 hypothetical protein [Gammaproteobacteria bacterium]